MKGYGDEEQSQTQGNWETQPSQPWSQSLASGPASKRAKARIQQQDQRRQIVNATLSFFSHWFQIPLEKMRDVWKSLPREKRTFKELQKYCLERDLSSTRREYDATRLFTQPSPRLRQREWQDDKGPARKKKKLGSPSVGHRSSSDTEDEDSSDIYIGGQDVDAWSVPHSIELEDDEAEEPPPVRFRQMRLVAGSVKNRFPYPVRPDKIWAKRVCRMLAATYGVLASEVYRIWERVDGNAELVENALKDTASIRQKVNSDLGLGEIPRPWLDV